MVLLALTADQVGAAAAAVQALVVPAGIWFAWRQIKEAVATREEQSRPYVAIYFEMTPGMESFPDLVVRNFGPTAAYNVTITVTPEIRSSTDGELVLREAGFLRNGIPTLPPGAEVRAFFDTMIDRPKDWELTYEAIVSYHDRKGESHRDRYVLDLTPHIGTSHITRRTLHDIHHQVEKLVKELHHLRSGFGGAMPVVVEERSVMIARKHREREEQMATYAEMRAKASRPVEGDGEAQGPESE